MNLSDFLIFYVSILAILVTLFAVSTNLSRDLKYSLIKKYIFNSNFFIVYFIYYLISFLLVIIFFSNIENYLIVVIVTTFIYTFLFVCRFFWLSLDKNELYSYLNKLVKNEGRYKKVEVLRDIFLNFDFVKNERNYLPRDEFECLLEIVGEHYVIIDSEFIVNLLDTNQFIELISNFNNERGIVGEKLVYSKLKEKNSFLKRIITSRIRLVKYYDDRFNSLGYFLLKPFNNFSIEECDNLEEVESFFDSINSFLTNLFNLTVEISVLELSDNDREKYLDSLIPEINKLLKNNDYYLENLVPEKKENLNKLRERIYDFHIYYFYLISYKVEVGLLDKKLFDYVLNIIHLSEGVEKYFINNISPNFKCWNLDLSTVHKNKYKSFQHMKEFSYEKYFLLYLFYFFKIGKTIKLRNKLENIGDFTKEFILNFYDFSDKEYRDFIKRIKNIN